MKRNLIVSILTLFIGAVFASPLEPMIPWQDSKVRLVFILSPMSRERPTLMEPCLT